MKHGEQKTRLVKTNKPWPLCPRCGSSAHVHRAGLHSRLQFPAAQRYSCFRCGKDKKFLAPNERKYRPGRIRQFREHVQPKQPPTPGTLKISVRAPLRASLQEMFSTSNGSGADRGDLSSFCSEIIECQIIAYRATQAGAKRLAILKLPPKPKVETPKRRFHHQRKISPADAEKIRNLLASGLNQQVVARRYSVAESTIARHLDSELGPP
jgi:hypothetical protein